MSTLTLNFNQTGFSSHYFNFSKQTSSDTTKANQTSIFVTHPETGDLIKIDPDQAWFWTEEWQAGEREVDQHIKNGEYETFDSMDDFFATL